MINLTPEKEAKLKAHAQAQGLSVEEWLMGLIDEDPAGNDLSIPMTFANLSDLLRNSPFAGANLNLERSQDYPRSVYIRNPRDRNPRNPRDRIQGTETSGIQGTETSIPENTA